MKFRLTNCSALAALFIALWAGYCHADPVIDWRTYKASPATTLAGQGTNDPIIGDLANSANASFVIGYLAAPAVLGANAGDSITLSFGVSFNDAVGMANAGDNFRFALFDTNGEAAPDTTAGGPNYATAGTDNTDNFRGYWLGVKNGTGTGSGGSIRERIAMVASGQNAFAATGANSGTVTTLGTGVGGDPVTLVSDVNGDNTGADYTGVLTLTRNVSGLVDISGSFLGSNAITGNVFSASDTTANASSTYGAVGFLVGNALNVDQVFFQNVDVTVPSAGQPGDHNGDGIVDAADYVAWRKLDEANPLGYDEFFENFGEGSGGGGGQQAAAGVPEPTVMGLLASVAMTLLGFARGRRIEFARALARRNA